MATKNTLNLPFSCRVLELLAKPFASRTEAEKLKIVSEGKPRPSLKMFCDGVKKEIGGVTYCARSMYNEIPWLTGCPARNKLYCWPCVLFVIEPSMWNQQGIADIIIVIEGKSLHEKTIAHMDAVIKLQMFINKLKSSTSILKSSTSMKEVLGINRNEERSRDVKKRLIDVCCTVIGQQSSNAYIFDIEKCLKVMQFIQNYDNHNKDASNDAINILKTFPKVINSVCFALKKVVNLEIVKEINSAKYVSVILSGHSDGNSLISTVLRYMVNGKICERFVRFTNLTNPNSDTVYHHVFNVMQEYGILGKINAISLDGSILKAETLVTFLKKMKENHPCCCFVPWHSYRVDHILQQCLSSHSTCGKFFKTMASMQLYFQRNCPLFTDLLSECDLTLLVKSNINSEYSSRFASSHFITAVNMQHESFMKFFDIVINNCQKWSADDLAKASGFQKFLQKLKTIFFLEIFSRIFNIVSPLDAAISDDKYNFENNMVLQITRDLTEMSTQEFKNLWVTVKTKIENSSFALKEYTSKKKYYISLFYSITELTMRDISIRFNPMDKLKFCNMFDFEEIEGSKHIQLWLQSLKETQRLDFSKTLINELIVLWRCNAFSVKSVRDFYHLISQSNTNNMFKVLTDVAELILTMPFKPAPVSGNISKLQMIDKWSVDVPSYDGASLFHIESELFEDIKKSPFFYYDTMNYFQLY